MFIGHTFNRTNDIGIRFIQVLRGIIQRVKETITLIRLRIDIGQSINTGIITITTRGITLDTFTKCKPIGTFWLCKAKFHITLPRDPILSHNQWLLPTVHTTDQGELIIEKGIGNQSTGINRYIPQSIQWITHFAINTGLILILTQ